MESWMPYFVVVTAAQSYCSRSFWSRYFSSFAAPRRV